MWEPAGSFDPRDFNNRPTKQMSFEQTAVRKLHRVWFPDLSLKLVEKEFKDNGEEFNWRTYKQYIRFDDHTPDIAFIKADCFWNICLHDLINKKWEKLPFCLYWDEQPGEVLVFPVIGIYGVCYRPKTFNRYESFITGDCLVKYTEDGGIVLIEDLRTFAESYKPSGGFEGLLMQNDYGE